MHNYNSSHFIIFYNILSSYIFCILFSLSNSKRTTTTTLQLRTGERHKDQRRWVPGGIKTYQPLASCRSELLEGSAVLRKSMPETSLETIFFSHQNPAGMISQRAARSGWFPSPKQTCICARTHTQSQSLITSYAYHGSFFFKWRFNHLLPIYIILRYTMPIRW